MSALRAADPARHDEILLRLRRYDERLRRFGLRDRHLDWQISTKDAVLFGLREAALGIVLLPLCLLGLAVFFVPYWLTWFVARRLARARDVVATAQVFSGAATYAAWLVLVCAFAWTLFGRSIGVLTLLSMPVLAVAALFAIERESAVIDAVRAWWLLRRAHRDTRARLRRRRSELADVLDEVHAWVGSVQQELLHEQRPRVD